MGIGDRVRCKIFGNQGIIHSRFKDTTSFHKEGRWWYVRWNGTDKKLYENSEAYLELI